MNYKMWEALKPQRLSSRLSGLCCVMEPMRSDAGWVWLRWLRGSLSSLILQWRRQSVIFIYLFAALPWQFWNFWTPVIRTHSWENRCLPPCAITAVIWVDYQTTQQVPATAVSICRKQTNLVRLGDRFIWCWHWDLVLKRTLIDFSVRTPLKKHSKNSSMGFGKFHNNKRLNNWHHIYTHDRYLDQIQKWRMHWVPVLDVNTDLLSGPSWVCYNTVYHSVPLAENEGVNQSPEVAVEVIGHEMSYGVTKCFSHTIWSWNVQSMGLTIIAAKIVQVLTSDEGTSE